MHTDFDPMGEVFFALCKSVGSPVALGAWLRYKYSHAELCSMDINPGDYDDAYSFAKDYGVVSFLSKWKGLNTGIDKEAVAIQKFTQSEVSCREANIRIRSLPTVRNERLHEVLHLAQRKIARLLGVYSTFAHADRYGWGPGASVGLPRRRAFLDTKMSELPVTVSRSARAMLRAEIEGDLQWSSAILNSEPEGPFCLMDSVFSIFDGCEITTVPKNAKTDRVIAIEPRGNAFLQKGFGSYYRDRLRSVGVDLDDQEVNQERARRSLYEGLATLDLKAASDSVSKELVYMLFPYDWASAMDAVRSRYAFMPNGERIVLEKFSSMGNGFTFELESLIFWAIAQSVSDLGSKGEVSVYGDDIIVHSSDAPWLIEVLSFLGFETNKEKSFLSGPFYESCGRHFFLGVDVTPVYQKETLNDSDLSMVRLGNRLIRWAFRLGFFIYLDKVVESAWRAARRHGCKTSQFYLPFGTEGDDGWLIPEDEFPPTRYSDMGFRCKVLKTVSRSFPANDRALLAWSLRRGVVTPTPFFGEVSRDQTYAQSRSRPSPSYSDSSEEKRAVLKPGTRFVHRGWQFRVIWG